MPGELFSDFDQPPKNAPNSLTRRLLGVAAVMGLSASLTAFALNNDVEPEKVDQKAWSTTTFTPQTESSFVDESSSEPTTALPTTSSEQTSTSTSGVPETTTTEPETTLPPTTTTEPRKPWTEAAYDPTSCDQPHNSVVHLDGADGKPVTAQIGVDYQIGGQKVDESGQVVTNPQQSYSKFVYVNLDNEGITQFCFNAPVGSTAYYEFYPKTVVPDGSHQIVESHEIYGGAMAHRAPDNVNVTLPIVCTNNQGQTGNIFVDSFSATRLVAWSQADLNTTPSPGFGVVDGEQLNVPVVGKLDSIAANQKYTFQSELFQVKDGKTIRATVVAHNVPVKPCNDTHVTFNFRGNTCIGQAQIDQQKIAIDCEATSKLG